jgi:hypothetical protein
MKSPRWRWISHLDPGPRIPVATRSSDQPKLQSLSISQPLIRRVSRAQTDRNPEGDLTMRFMIMIKADKASEAGALPDEKLLTEKR